MGHLYLITAFTDKDYVIGNKNGLPWNYREDLKFFKEKTMGQVVIMGYRTFESIGKSLPGRINIVISNEVHGVIYEKGCYMMRRLEDAVEYAKENYPLKDIFVIGGSKIYQDSLEKCIFDKIYVTRICKEYEGDIFFPYSSLITKYQPSSQLKSFYHPELIFEEWIYISS